MVIRGRVPSRFCSQAPRRRKPDWDNNIHDLRTLKLTPAELEAKLKAVKLKQWSRPERAPSSGTESSSHSGHSRSRQSRDSEEGDAHAEQTMRRIQVRNETVALKQSSVCTSDEEDDFDEDIKRLESLQAQQPRFPALRNSNDGVGCSQQFLRGSPNLLEYLETEMQKAWSEMSISKEKQVAKSQRKPIRRRIKLQLGEKKKTQELKMLDMILANQHSSALSTSQTFAEELHKHVVYQQHVIQELNQFRMSATRELTNLVTLVQKLLTIQETKTPEQGDSQAQGKAKGTALCNNVEPETCPLRVDTTGTPPKPRQVPIFLMKRASTVRPPQLQGLPETRKTHTSFMAESVKEKEQVDQDTRSGENVRHHLVSKPGKSHTREDRISSKDPDGAEEHTRVVDLKNRRLPPTYVAKPVEEQDYQEVERREHTRCTDNRRCVSSAHGSQLPKDEFIKEGASVINRTENARITENKRRLPSTNVSKTTEELAREGHISADEFDRRENPLFESDLHGKPVVAIPRGPFKKSRLQEQSASPRWKMNRPVHGSDRPGNEQVVPAAPPEAKPSTRKPNVDQDRFVTVSRKQQQQQLPRSQQEGPSKLNDSRTQLQKADSVRKIGPRYRLQGWSAAFLQTERMRGKENSIKRKNW